MRLPQKPVIAFSLATAVALSGCATRLPPNPTGADVKGQVPAEGLPRVSRVVANEVPIVLAGFWNDPKEREAFEKKRAEIIAQRVEANRTSGARMANGIVSDSLFACIVFGPLCVVVLPAMIPVAAIVGTADYTEARIVAGRGVDYIPITEQNSARLSALYSGTLTGVALGERTLQLIQAGPAPVDATAEFPRLVVTMKSASVRMDADEELHVTVVAQAQAQPAPGVTWPATEHVIDMEFWQRYDYTVAVQKILDVLAHSIVATYLPQHPASAEKRLWDEARTKDAASVQAYLDRYPAGTYAEPARARAAELAARKRAADQAPANAVTAVAAARTVFAQRARIHPAVEGTWTGTGATPICGRARYTIVVKEGLVTGTVEWDDSGQNSAQVAGYVGEDGVMSAVVVTSSRVDRSRVLDLSPSSQRLEGPSNVACRGQFHRVTLYRG